MASVKGRGRVGRVGDVAVDGMGHLVTDDGELIHLHERLVLSVDALVSQKTGSGDLRMFISNDAALKRYHEVDW